MEALDRLADLGVDGFRFDLAAVFARDADFVRSIGDWGERRGVRLIAEPWDMARYLLGPDFPDQRWMQWNGEFRDDVRGFLRGEPGMVPLMVQRLAGSPDLFTSPTRSLNFLTAHDGFTMYDLVAYDHRHNEANGWDNTDGHHHNRSWNCGWEGDDRRAWRCDDAACDASSATRCACCCSATGCRCSSPVTSSPARRAATTTPTTRTTRPHGSTGIVPSEWADHERFVREVIAVRAAHPVLWRSRAVGRTGWRTFGASGAPDRRSRVAVDRVGDRRALCDGEHVVGAGRVRGAGAWRLATVVSTRRSNRDALTPRSASWSVTVGPRSIVVLER